MITTRADLIIKEAEEHLDYFYKVFGDWDGTGKRPAYRPLNRKKCKQEGCKKSVADGSKFCPAHETHKSKTVIAVEEDVSLFDVGLEEEIDRIAVKKAIKKAAPKKPVPPKAPSPKAVTPPAKVTASEGPGAFKGMSGKGIIDMVHKLTGQLITISIKSKKNIIKHALKIFSEKGIKV